MTGHDADDVTAAVLSGMNGVAHKRRAVQGEELLGLAEAGGAAGSEDYAADSWHWVNAGVAI